MKILIMTDSLFIPTGLGRVGKELALGLSRHGHDIAYIGWFHRPDILYNLPQGVHYWSTNNNLYGSDVLDQAVNQFMPDVLLTIGDMWWLSYIADSNVCKTRKYFQWCAYIPVDGEPLNGGIPKNIIPIIDDVDMPIAYTDYAKTAILKSTKDSETRMRIRTIYHGVDTNVFRPIPFMERKKIRENFGLDDQFIFLTVCRNQSRKNIPDMMRAWKIFSELPETKGKVIWWPHTNFRDSMGWNIQDLFDEFQLRNNSIKYYKEIANGVSELHLLPDEELAKIYQLSDAFFLMSGEGFGLPTIEAMATKLPCILLDYAASSELGAEGRAEMVPVTECSWTGMRLTQRPIPSIKDMVDAMLKIYSERKRREDISQKGYDFATQYTWNRIVSEWNHLFIHNEVPFFQPIEMEVCS